MDRRSRLRPRIRRTDGSGPATSLGVDQARGTIDDLVLLDHVFTDGTAAWHGDRVRDEYELAPFRAFVPGTRSASMFPGLQTATINSINHQGIKDLAPDFVV